MAWFACFMHGENFPGQLADAAGLVGFYVTRFIEADDPACAEAAAIQGLRADPNLSRPPRFTPTKQARVFVEEIEEVEAADVPAVQPGFVWYAADA
jgi:hypothetical protein